MLVPSGDSEGHSSKIVTSQACLESPSVSKPKPDAHVTRDLHRHAVLLMLMITESWELNHSPTLLVRWKSIDKVSYQNDEGRMPNVHGEGQVASVKVHPRGSGEAVTREKCTSSLCRGLNHISETPLPE